MSNPKTIISQNTVERAAAIIPKRERRKRLSPAFNPSATALTISR
jgi:hypothetical protein